MLQCNICFSKTLMLCFFYLVIPSKAAFQQVQFPYKTTLPFVSRTPSGEEFFQTSNRQTKEYMVSQGKFQIKSQNITPKKSVKIFLEI